jgi:hypothetical protein
VFEQTNGYPHFLQQYGKYIWDVASQPTITVKDARTGGREAQERLDDGFFLARYERATPPSEPSCRQWHSAKDPLTRSPT